VLLWFQYSHQQGAELNTLKGTNSGFALALLRRKPHRAKAHVHGADRTMIEHCTNANSHFC